MKYCIYHIYLPSVTAGATKTKHNSFINSIAIFFNYTKTMILNIIYKFKSINITLSKLNIVNNLYNGYLRNANEIAICNAIPYATMNITMTIVLKNDSS